MENYPDLTEKQIQFVRDVIASGLEDKLQAYSGRGMYGRHCPGVRVAHTSELQTKVRYSQDNLGLDYILYCP